MCTRQSVRMILSKKSDLPKLVKSTSVRDFGHKAACLGGHNLRLYVAVVAVKLLLGNFGYKAV
jgi:hypothetical protein